MNTTMNEGGASNGTEDRHPKGRRPAAGERERILSDWTTNGRTVAEMAAATGWSTHTSYRWRHEADRRRRRSGAVPKSRLVVVPKPAAMAAPWAAELTIGTANLRLAPGLSAGWVAELLRELKSC